MLTDLNIRNFAIIDQLHVSFDRGFNILTGETGAGKSIIIDAVNLILGGRARSELIRTGENEASVEGLFDLSERPQLQQSLQDAGFDPEEELLVRRTVSRTGKNRVFLNGAMATLAQLQSLAPLLVNIYGQHEHQGLQRPETHLGILDHFAGLENLRETYGLLFDRYENVRKQLTSLDRSERDRQQRLDLLDFQSREISEMNIHAGEDDELESERRILQNSERLAAATRGGYDILYSREGAVCELVNQVAADLEALSEVDETLGHLGETARSAFYTLEDCATQLRDYSGGLSFEPHRLDEVEQRLSSLNTLKRKYAETLQGVLDHQEKIDRELEELSDTESTRETLKKRLVEAEAELHQTAESLSEKRRFAALDLARAMQDELRALAMPNVCFEVRFSPLENPGSEGLEKAEFYFSANPGEEARPLARIASGGELSRLMLALRRTAPQSDSVMTVVFDEVDAGIGGVAATAVGEKLKQVAGGCQVLCITHLPQVAGFADHHFHVEKREEQGRTFAVLNLLDHEDRVAEMARMLGGAKVTDATYEHAREFIAQADEAGSR